MIIQWRPWETVYEAKTDEYGVIGPILVAFGKEGVSICMLDPYYAEGGRGYEGHSGWIIDKTAEAVELHYTDAPSAWMPLPEPPR